MALQSNPNDAPKKDISQLYELVLKLNEEAAIISTEKDWISDVDIVRFDVFHAAEEYTTSTESNMTTSEGGTTSTGELLTTDYNSKGKLLHHFYLIQTQPMIAILGL